MRKGEQTRLAIVSMAVDIAAQQGLEGLTIGGLAERMQMSKSGVFAHFGSREDLQIAVLHAYERQFIEEIMKPALQQPRGIARLRVMLDRWLTYVADGHSGCVWVSGAVEFDDRPGPVREALVSMIGGWHREVRRAIEQTIQTGDLHPDTDIDALVFESQGIVLAVHHDLRLLNNADALKRGRHSLYRLLRACTSVPDLIPDEFSDLEQ